ncbi:hypothetical protein R84981_002857 [Carnimonas sp. R-84981]|uniref:hypothetical protein n=1 Tax=Carnimonas bestiolae TaxID=3402172 RepID=UPI003EDC81B7
MDNTNKVAHMTTPEAMAQWDVVVSGDAAPYPHQSKEWNLQYLRAAEKFIKEIGDGTENH